MSGAELLKLAHEINVQQADYITRQNMQSSLDSQTEDHANALESMFTMQNDQGVTPDEPLDSLTDDFHSLSFTSSQRSLLGISSFQIAIKVLYHLDPESMTLINQANAMQDHDKLSVIKKRRLLDASTDISNPTKEHCRMIATAFFQRFQPMAPLVDEKAFWHHFEENDRSDVMWTSLFQIVLALGLTACPTQLPYDPYLFAANGRRLCVMVCLDSKFPSIDVIRVMGLIGGYWALFVGQANQATLALTIACSLSMLRGLHVRNYEQLPESERYIWCSLCTLSSWINVMFGQSTIDHNVIQPLVVKLWKTASVSKSVVVTRLRILMASWEVIDGKTSATALSSCPTLLHKRQSPKPTDPRTAATSFNHDTIRGRILGVESLIRT